MVPVGLMMVCSTLICLQSKNNNNNHNNNNKHIVLVASAVLPFTWSMPETLSKKFKTDCALIYV